MSALKNRMFLPLNAPTHIRARAIARLQKPTILLHSPLWICRNSSVLCLLAAYGTVRYATVAVTVPTATHSCTELKALSIDRHTAVPGWKFPVSELLNACRVLSMRDFDITVVLCAITRLPCRPCTIPLLSAARRCLPSISLV